MTQKKNYNIEELETRYNEVTTLFDQAEELVATVESEFVKDQQAQLDVVEPLINEIGDATDVLAEEFLLIAESKKYKTSGKASKNRIEGALRKIYVAIGEYQARVKGSTKRAQGAILNIADPIVQKIQRQVEKIVVIFLEFMQISLHNIMNKAEVEALRERDARVALMMHQQALSQQQ
jgi:hypothetical protein